MSTCVVVRSLIGSKTSAVQTSNVGFTSEVPDYLVMHTGPELGLDEDGFDAGGFSTVQDFKAGDIILPMYSWYRPKSMHVEGVQFLNVPAVQCPRFTSIDE